MQVSDVMDTFPIQAPAFNGTSRTVPAGNAIEWLKQGWVLFVVNPGLWIALTVVMMVILVGLNVVPLIGSLAANLLTPVLAAGMLLSCQKAASGEKLDVGELFAGFKQNTGNLVMLGVIYMASMLLIFAVVFALAGGSMAGGAMMGRAAGFGLAFGGMMLAILLSFALMVPLFMAYWFAPALVFFNNMPPLEALKASFNASLKNMLPLLVYGLIVLALLFFAVVPVFLGFLVLIPVLFGSLYASYRDIFVSV